MSSPKILTISECSKASTIINKNVSELHSKLYNVFLIIKTPGIFFHSPSHTLHKNILNSLMNYCEDATHIGNFFGI